MTTDPSILINEDILPINYEMPTPESLLTPLIYFNMCEMMSVNYN